MVNYIWVFYEWRLNPDVISLLHSWIKNNRARFIDDSLVFRLVCIIDDSRFQIVFVQMYNSTYREEKCDICT
jgi:hypothetical protein